MYSQKKEATEYNKYIKHLQSKKMLGDVVRLEVEDLQGVLGLKALRVSVLYEEDFNKKSTLTIKDLIG